ncbi:MAG: Adenylate cyclase 1 [Syntrophorhabdus sp. PtaU1.Bin058]|nr:MAG: Adenylate cyclase 1 [Syntrophorhabdus sp. PtaU1.Bin058]
MNLYSNRFNEIFLKKQDLYYKLILSIGLLFVFPAFGFLFFAFKYNILQDKSLPLFLIGFLIFSFLGFVFLRTIFRKISRISDEFSERVACDLSDVHFQRGADELNTIVDSFNALENQLKNTLNKLEKRGSEISTLKELSDLCYVTFDTDELLYVTLERALKLVNADIGSVMILERPQRKTFIVQAHIGIDGPVKVGNKVDFDTSIAKYAVINKSPLLVEDIEKDSRFGRNNRKTYGTKSFICMPLKTIGDIIGVVTISRKGEDVVFAQADVDVLTPLLSNASFTYENIRLFKENELGTEIVKTTIKIFKTINSSLRNSELMYSVLHEIQSLISYDLAIVMVRDDNHPDDLMIYDILSRGPINLTKGSYHHYKDTIFDKVIQQETTLLVVDTGLLTHDIERELLVNQYSEASLLSALRISGEVRGILVLCAPNKDSLNKELEFVEVAKDGVAFALERTRLSASVARRSQEFDTLKQIGGALAASTFDINRVLKYAMDMIRVAMDVEAGSLLLLRGDELEFKVSFDIDAAVLGQSTIKIGQGIAGYVASQGKAITVNDVRQSPHFFPAVDETTGFTTRSALCVPMISKGKVIGVIELLNKRNGDFGYNDEQLLQSITSSLIIAIENARLYQETVSMTEHERGIRQIFQKFVPKEIVDKIIHGEATGKPLLDEFRTLTFLNIDIRGFSKLAKTIGPHRTVPMINYFFTIMGDIVFKHQGIVDKYLGDGFLALFGAPVSSVSDADNAIAAALDMKKAIEPVSDYFRKEVGAQLFMGIAIHTGEAVIGNIGFEKKMDYTVIGDAVNTVFRLQDIVKPLMNGILISEKTRKAAQSRLDVREIGEYEIDAALEKIKVYELLSQIKV